MREQVKIERSGKANIGIVDTSRQHISEVVQFLQPPIPRPLIGSYEDILGGASKLDFSESYDGVVCK